MKSFVPKLLSIVLATAWLAVIVSAQNPPSENAEEFAESQRPNLIQALDLDQDQIKQIRLMNRKRKPLMEAAQTRLREANRALDVAIYGDNIDDAQVSARLKDYQNAQAEVARIRFRSEFALRRILRPDQLGRFRQLRQRVANARKEQRLDRGAPAARRPLRRIRQLPSQVQPNK